MDAQLRLLAGESRGESRSEKSKAARSRGRVTRTRRAAAAHWATRWSIGPAERARGLAGIAKARQALEGSRPPAPEGVRRAS